MSPSQTSTNSSQSVEGQARVLVLELPHSERRQFAPLPTLPDFDVLCENFYAAVQPDYEQMARENKNQGSKVQVEDNVPPSTKHPDPRVSDSPASLDIQLHDYLVTCCLERNKTSLRLAIQSIIRAPTLADIQEIILQFDNLTVPIDTIAKNCLAIRNRNDKIARARENQRENQGLKIEGHDGPDLRHLDSPRLLETQLLDYLASCCTERNKTSLRLAIQSIMRAITLDDIEEIICEFDDLTAPIETIARTCLAIRERNKHVAQVHPGAIPHAQQGDGDETLKYMQPNPLLRSFHTTPDQDPPTSARIISSISTLNPPNFKKKANQTSSTSEIDTRKNLSVKDRAAQINQVKVKFKWWLYHGLETSIECPTVIPEDEKTSIGDLYFYYATAHATAHTTTPPSKSQVWMFTTNRTWADITASWKLNDGSLRHPLDGSRILAIRDDGTPTYIAESTWRSKVRENEKITARVEGIASNIGSMSISQ